jgi:hypothetical protein
MRPDVDGRKSKATESQGSPNYLLLLVLPPATSPHTQTRGQRRELDPGNKHGPHIQYFSSRMRIMQNSSSHWRL